MKMAATRVGEPTGVARALLVPVEEVAFAPVQGDVARDLVVDRAQASRDFLHGNAVVAVGSDDGDGIAYPDAALCSDVDSERVHRHAAHDRIAASIYENFTAVAQRSEDAITISDGHESDVS
jgi:hypothetical protein